MEPEGSLPHSQVPATCPYLEKLDPVHTPTSHFLKDHLNIILPSTPGSPKWSVSFRFSHQNSVYASPLPHTRYMPRPMYDPLSQQRWCSGWVRSTHWTDEQCLFTGQGNLCFFFWVHSHRFGSLQLCPTVRYTLLTATGRSGGPTTPST